LVGTLILQLIAALRAAVSGGVRYQLYKQAKANQYILPTFDDVNCIKKLLLSSLYCEAAGAVENNI
jgi:hypothetical protein